MALSDADRAVIAVMSEYPLKPGQMLIMGAQSVRILGTKGMYQGKLPDKFVLEREEWNVKPATTKPSRAKPRRRNR